MKRRKILTFILLTLMLSLLMAAPAMAALSKSTSTNWAFTVMRASGGVLVPYPVSGASTYNMNYTQVWAMTGPTTGYWDCDVTSQTINTTLYNARTGLFNQTILMSNVKYNTTVTYYLTCTSVTNVGTVDKYYKFGETVTRHYHSTGNSFVPVVTWSSSTTGITPNMKAIEWQGVGLP